MWCVWLLSHVLLFAIPWIVAHHPPLSMEILQARIVEGVPMPSFGGSSQPRDWTQISLIAGRFFTVWATRDLLQKYFFNISYDPINELNIVQVSKEGYNLVFVLKFYMLFNTFSKYLLAYFQAVILLKNQDIYSSKHA